MFRLSKYLFAAAVLASAMPALLLAQEVTIDDQSPMKVFRDAVSSDPLHTYEGCKRITAQSNGVVQLSVSVIAVSAAGGNWIASVAPTPILEGKTEVLICVFGQGVRIENLHCGSLDLPVARVTVWGDKSPVCEITVIMDVVCASSTPTISTVDAHEVKSTSALLEGGVVDDGGEVCEYRFRYWREGQPEMFTAWVGEVRTSDVFAERVEGLDPTSLYHVEAQARNSLGIGYGGPRDFTTLPCTLDITSTAGGSVTTPGEGTFQYAGGIVVAIAAMPAANCHFVSWTGTAVVAGKVANPSSASTTVTMDADYTLQANFATDQGTPVLEYVVKPVNATASSSMTATMGPDKTIDGSGLDTSDHHGTAAKDMWLSKKNQPPVWIQYEFDKVYQLSHMWVWNQNQVVEPDVGFGAKDVTIQYSTDGTTWTTLAGVPQFAEATGQPNYVHNTTVDFRGVQARYVKLAINSNWAGGTKQAGLSEVRFFYLGAPPTLTTSSTNGGTVAAPGVGSFYYDPGTWVPVVATPAANYHFVDWTGTAVAAGKVADPCSARTAVTVDADYTLQANFAVDQRTLTTSSTSGGTVTTPGVGSFYYDPGASVTVVAAAAANYHFVSWTGTAVAAGKVGDPLSPSTTVIVDSSCTLVANFESDVDTLYVGAPGSVDPNGDGTQGHPFDQLQKAIEVAAEGSRVVIGSGTYTGTLNLMGKTIELVGTVPNGPGQGSWTVIDAQGAGPVVTFTYSGESQCTLSGLVLTGGSSDKIGAVSCSGTRLTIRNCLIVGNRATDPNGGVVYCRDSNVAMVNCTIADNYAAAGGAGVYTVDSNVVLLNSILWGNLPSQIVAESGLQPRVTYSDVSGSWPGTGNLDTDPLFVLPGHWADPLNSVVPASPADPASVWVPGDYHLMSQAGRWDPVTKTWVNDTETSPCIDAGDPNSPIGQEPLPNGGRVNMGAYGGTPQASLSNG